MRSISQMVEDSNPSTIPMTETHYYKWLKDGRRADVHAHDTKKEYLLECFGFVVGSHHLHIECIKALKYIECYYFDTEIAPTLKLAFKDSV